MAPEPLAADRTYQRLKSGILAGEYRPGISLNLQKLGDEFGTSITPIRDAIHRMVGERLLAVVPGGGFHIPVPTVQELRDLYHWHEQLIRQALRATISAARFAELADDVPAETAGKEFVACTAHFFMLVAALPVNREIAYAVANASDRLSLARLREPLIIKAMSCELGKLVSLAKAGRGDAVRTAVREYHRRRLRRINRIALAMHA